MTTLDGRGDPAPTPAPIPLESAEDLYDRAPCGYLSTRPDGTIVRVNRTLLDWTGHAARDLLGRRFLELLRGGGPIFHETHFAPLLLLQGEVREIAFDLGRADGTTLPVLVNALLVRDDEGEPLVVRIVVYDATTRHGYEQELLRARLRAEASELQLRGVAETLQRSLMHGTLTGGDGFTVETLYRPAVESLEVGGDWHDAVWLPGRTGVALSVGDVVGRGIRAACAMGQLRSAIRAIATSGAGPAATLDLLDAFVEGVPDAKVATVAYAQLETATGELRYTCAGHLPPLLLAPGRPAELLWDGRSRPLGLGRVDRPTAEGVVALAPGARVVLYTDGLVERRTRDIDDSLDRLADTADRLRDRPPAEFVAALTDELLADEDVRDDVCVLCLDLHRPA